MVERICEDNDSADNFVRKIAQGGVVCFKSDTVYALACDASNDDAVKSLYKIKSRDYSKPIAIYVKDIVMAELIFDFDETLKTFCQNYLPGFVTIVAKKRSDEKFLISKELNLESNHIGFRIINSDLVSDVMDRFNGPIAVTSANLSGYENVTNPDEIEKQFNDIDLLLIDSGLTESDMASTVVHYENKNFKILRQGKLYFNDELFN